MARPGPLNRITDVPGIRVGSAHDARVRTGVTVIRPEAPAVAAVDVRGGGPGTRETELLGPENLVDTVDALVLAGGSVYGLAAADGVAAALGARGEGFRLGAPPKGTPPSPIVPAAILYDLANGGAKDWGERPPYRDLGRTALAAAEEENAAAFALGRAGAGYGARAGAGPGGLGSASVVTGDGVAVGALAAVNSHGSVRVPGSEAFWAWPYEQMWNGAGEFGGVRPSAEEVARALDLEDWGAAKSGGGAPGALGAGPRANTTLAVVAVDAVLTPAEAKRVAVMAQAGLARAIRPIHGPFDGDVVFALATGRTPLAAPAAASVMRLGALAADCLARAVARGVWLAEQDAMEPPRAH